MAEAIMEVKLGQQRWCVYYRSFIIDDQYDLNHIRFFLMFLKRKQ